MINLAHSAHKKVIAEGVETQAIHQRLGQFSLDAMQGYWLSPPIPPAQIEMLLSLQQEMME
jgi:EAL domain-containing protein (putative c-di-GMP-specific phosphodiesterase class I)